MDDVRMLVGNSLEVLPTLEDCSVQMAVTSPPYYMLRDYGTTEWVGGNAKCDHIMRSAENINRRSTLEAKIHHTHVINSVFKGKEMQYVGTCRKCGAHRVDDHQIGQEPTPDGYVRSLVAVFREFRRVLRDDGTLWLNLGDCYASHTRYDYAYESHPGRKAVSTKNHGKRGQKPSMDGWGDIKNKDLLGIPWMVAFAMRADGWYFRSPIIWEKATHVPESVGDRVTLAHEYIFMFSKSPQYYYDKHAISEPSVGNPRARRNARSIWKIKPKPYFGSHFAVFPPDLPMRCIRAGTSERGACPKCGTGWIREVFSTPTHHDAPSGTRFSTGSHAGRISMARQSARARKKKVGSNSARADFAGPWEQRGELEYVTMHRGWRPGCNCYGVPKWIGMPSYSDTQTISDAERAKILVKQDKILKQCEQLETAPCVVMDMFSGSGTTGLAASQLGRKAVLIELNPRYAEDAMKRIQSRGASPRRRDVVESDQHNRFF